MNIRETAPRISELEKISTRTDTRDYLAKAATVTEKLKDWLVVDALGNAYNRWLIEQILPQDKRQKALLYLAVQSIPEASVETVERFADAPGVVGFSVTSTRHKPVWHNSLHAALRSRWRRPASRSASMPASPGAIPPFAAAQSLHRRCTRCRS